MMLVHKPPSFNIAPTVPHAHRRHPSAPPAVVVQPTKTPGLLSISKPARTTHNRHMNSHQRRENNNAKAPSKTAKSQAQPLVARAPALLNPAEISHKKPAPPALQDPASPTPQQRGRGSKHAREKAQQQKRTHSQSPVRGKHSRQPSPPVEIQIQQQSLQAEVKFPSSNHFDPFLEQLSGAMPTPSPSPKQQHKQNRKQQQQQSPPVSESIPVPRIVRPKPQNISRSGPEVSHMPSRGLIAPRPSKFPICDDMTDAGDLSEPESPGVPTPPATPVRKQAFNDKTYLVNAPISTKAPAGFPFTYPSPPVSNKGRKHRRAPSEGVFHMSSDEDLSSGPGGVVLNQNLFGLARNRSPQAKAPSTPPSLNRAAGTVFINDLNGQKVGGYFASSLFQNSPSPDELPDPNLF